jgi:hypothetical protein
VTIPRSVLLLSGLLALGTGCSVGQGTGSVTSTDLFAHECWGTPVDATHAVGAAYDMQPNFFAANPYRTSLQIWVQHGSDLTEVSDGLAVLIDDICPIRSAIPGTSAAAGACAGVTLPTGGGTGGSGTGGGGTTDGGTGDGGVSDGGSADGGGADGGGAGGGAPGPTSFRVAVPVGVHPPGSPEQLPPDLIANPPIVHMALYLERSCHNQNTVLYGVDGYITFSALFDGDPDETSADDKLSTATFDVQFGDLSDVPIGAYVGDVPPGLQSRVTGFFNFYFERGQPAQPFP